MQLLLCWFHMRQNGHKRLRSMRLDSLLNSPKLFAGGTGTRQVKYTFFIWVRIIYAHAYVPVNDVLAVYRSIEWPEVLLDFLKDYFEG